MLNKDYDEVSTQLRRWFWDINETLKLIVFALIRNDIKQQKIFFKLFPLKQRIEKMGKKY